MMADGVAEAPPGNPETAPGGSEFARAVRRAPRVIVAGVVLLLILLPSYLAPWVAPHEPFTVGSFNLMDSELPPAFLERGDPRFWLGTDAQGRDVLSGILYGTRLSVSIGLGAVLISALIGCTLGLVAGYVGGLVDALVMRVADVILSFPTILIALLVSGIARGMMPAARYLELAPLVLVLAIAINEWVQYARTVRGSAMVEAKRDYVRAARVMGLPAHTIMRRHILPNILSPILVIGTINLALAILTEATLSFLGVGLPPTSPSLGTLIRIGNEYLFSGIWWVVVFPSLTLVTLVLCMNVIGDFLRDYLNPKLR